MSAIDLASRPHRRFNPLTREWVLVSPQRTERPWQGQVENIAPEAQVRFDPNCYLCPGSVRAGGVRNPAYPTTFVFDNDFAALKPEVPAQEVREGELLVARSETGRCRVVCYSPRHDLETLRKLNGSLELIHRPFGHRVYRAILDYLANYPGAENDEGRRRHALADQFEQKIVPKLRGLDTHDDAVRKCLDDIEGAIAKLEDNKLESALADARSQSLFEWFGVKRS